MDSTNNEIYKIAKYLDKYTKYGNKEGGVYLQKLDNYLHKVQYGGNGIVDLAQQIGVIVDEVVEEHQQVKGKLGELLSDASGQDLEDKYENKLEALKAAKKRLETDIAQKKAEKLASKALASSAPGPATPVSPAPAPASSAAEPAPRERVPLTAEKQEQKEQAQIIAKDAQQEKIRREAQNLADGKPTNYDELTTDTFDVMGYIVNPQTGKVFGKVDDGVYKFPEEQKSVRKRDGNSREINVLQSLSQQSIIDVLQITDQTKTGSFNLNGNNTIFRIKLDNLNIREFVDKINKEKKVVKLTSSGDTKNVRLFVKPMSYTPVAGKDFTEEQQQINEFAEIISKAIRLLVAQPPPKQTQGVEV